LRWLFRIELKEYILILLFIKKYVRRCNMTKKTSMVGWLRDRHLEEAAKELLKKAVIQQPPCVKKQASK
jgi:hypothetical protein